MARLAVVGPGSVGTYFAAQLAAAGHDVLACARRPFSEYVVESRTAPVRMPARVVTDPGALGDAAPLDGVLLCVKAYQTRDAAPWLARLCGEGTVLVVVQNGTEGAERAAPFAGGATVVPSVVYCGAELLEPGHIVHYAAENLIVPATRHTETMVPWFEGVAATLTRADDYATPAWRKLGANVVANGITALTMRPLAVLADPAIASVARRLLTECWAVARAEGASLGPDDVDAFVSAVSGRPSGGTSMLYDRRAGRPTEHDALYGAVVRAAARHGIDVPLHETFLALLAAGDPDAGPAPTH